MYFLTRAPRRSAWDTVNQAALLACVSRVSNAVHNPERQLGHLCQSRANKFLTLGVTQTTQSIAGTLLPKVQNRRVSSSMGSPGQCYKPAHPPPPSHLIALVTFQEVGKMRYLQKRSAVGNKQKYICARVICDGQLREKALQQRRMCNNPKDVHVILEKKFVVFRGRKTTNSMSFRLSSQVQAYECTCKFAVMALHGPVFMHVHCAFIFMSCAKECHFKLGH